MGSFPVVHQIDDTDCGAACLATVARVHGHRLSMIRLRRATDTRRSGVTMFGLREAARKMGYDARGIDVSDRSSLMDLPAPWIAHVRKESRNHFVVVHAVKDDRVVVGDPAEGVRRPTRETFDAEWTGKALLLKPTGEWHLEGMEVGSPWRRILDLSASFRGIFFLSAGCGFAVTALLLGFSFLVRHLFDRVIPGGNFTALHAAGAAMLSVSVAAVGFGFLRSLLTARLAAGLRRKLLTETVRRLLRLPVSFFHARRSGEVLRRLGDAAGIHRAVSGIVLGAILDGATLLAAAGVLLLHDPLPAALLLGSFLLFLLVSLFLVSPVRRRHRRFLEHSAELDARTVETLQAVEAVKGCVAEESVSEELARRIEGTVREERATSVWRGVAEALTALVQGLVYLGVFWLGAALVMRGSMTIGQVVFFSSVVGYVVGPLRNLSSLPVGLQDALVSMERLADVLETEEEPVAGKEPDAPMKGEIVAEKISFSYGPGSEVFRDFSFRIPPGSRVAVVGESGAGKSTLFRLLLRFFEPDEGMITCDGIDARLLSRSWIRRQIVLVDQECRLFSGTLLENLKLARPESTMEEVVEACRSAEILSFIESLPENFETPLGERGVGLSAGERQRLVLARAILARPSVLLLDEATVHQEADREERLLQRLWARKDLTVVLATHRKDLQEKADVVISLRPVSSSQGPSR